MLFDPAAVREEVRRERAYLRIVLATGFLVVLLTVEVAAHIIYAAPRLESRAICADHKALVEVRRLAGLPVADLTGECW